MTSTMTSVRCAQGGVRVSSSANLTHDADHRTAPRHPHRRPSPLARAGTHYELNVSNDGPPIPEALLGRLFESLFENRQGTDDRPHFGLGLYIVRLIAEFHGGVAVAANRPDAGGAVLTVVLPFI